MGYSCSTAHCSSLLSRWGIMSSKLQGHAHASLTILCLSVQRQFMSLVGQYDMDLFTTIFSLLYVPVPGMQIPEHIPSPVQCSAMFLNLLLRASASVYAFRHEAANLLLCHMLAFEQHSTAMLSSHHRCVPVASSCLKSSDISCTMDMTLRHCCNHPSHGCNDCRTR